VIELRRLPGGRVVASVAGLRESAGYVIGVRRVLEILQVARNACCAAQVVIIVDVAVGALAGRNGMRPRQREVHHGVVKRRGRPGDCRMTLRAVRREVRRNVIWIRRALEIFQVAANAGCAGQVVIAINMTIGALPRGHGVPASQGESYGRMVKARIQPVVGPMAVVAGRREPGCHVVRIRGALKVGGVARIAFSRHRLKPAVCSALVARIAIHSRVRAGQGKAVVMLLHLLDRDLPPANRVALFTVGSKLPLVNIGMAVLAALANTAEHRFHMTLGARHRLMHAAEGISGLIVIEFRNGAYRFPPARCVTVLTGDVQISVRTVRASRRLRPHISRRSGNRQETNQE